MYNLDVISDFFCILKILIYSLYLSKYHSYRITIIIVTLNQLDCPFDPLLVMIALLWFKIDLLVILNTSINVNNV